MDSQKDLKVCEIIWRSASIDDSCDSWQEAAYSLAYAASDAIKNRNPDGALIYLFCSDSARIRAEAFTVSRR